MQTFGKGYVQTAIWNKNTKICTQIAQITQIMYNI